MLGTIPDAGGTVRVFALRVGLPRVGGRVVVLHRRALLRAHAIVVEVAARDAVALLGALATARAEQVAAIARVRPVAPALPALRAAVRFRKLLTVLWTLTPASRLTTLVARRTFALRRRKIVHVDVLGFLPRYDLFPVYCAHVAEVVVFVDADATAEHVAQGGQLERVRVRQRHDERELLVAHVQFEKSPASDDL